MAYNQFNCAFTEFRNTGFDKCDIDLSGISLIVLAKSSFEFATEADALDQDDWITAIQAKNIFPLPLVYDMTDQSEEDGYETSPFGVEKLSFEGKYKMKFMLDAPLGVQVNLRSFNNGDLRVFYVDHNNNVLGYSEDGVKFKGFEVELFRTEKMPHVQGRATRRVVVKIVEKDAAQFNDYGATFTPTWNAKDLEGLKDCDFTIVGTPSATAITVDIKTSLGQVPVEGLVVGDLLLVKASDGATQTISSATESTTVPGRYALAGTGLVTGTLSFKAPSAMTTEGYDTGASATVTIS